MAERPFDPPAFVHNSGALEAANPLAALAATNLHGDAPMPQCRTNQPARSKRLCEHASRLVLDASDEALRPQLPRSCPAASTMKSAAPATRMKGAGSLSVTMH